MAVVFQVASSLRRGTILMVVLAVLTAIYGQPRALAERARLEATARGEASSITDQDRAFWSFQQPIRPPTPRVRHGHQVRTPIDAFILRRLEQNGLALNPDADRGTLIRRLYYDMLGLPPDPNEVAAFVADPDPQSYEKLVDRVLASPHYGERWGRYWLDVVGFAESSLFIGDKPRPDFWRYRDYVIGSLNADKPYDQFVREQLAGDEMFDWRAVDLFSPDQIDKLVATGFLRCPPDATDNQPIMQEEKMYAAQQAAMEVSMKALMGLTLNCVRCHSHKYDPLPHEDYYQLIAVFQPAYDPANWLAGIWSDANPGTVRAIPLLDRRGREKYFRQSRAWKAERSTLTKELNKELPLRWRMKYIRDHLSEIAENTVRDRVKVLVNHIELSKADAALVSQVALELGLSREKLQEAYPEYEHQQQQIRDRLTAINKEAEKLPPVAWGLFDVSTTPSPTRLLDRGNYETPAHEVPPGVLTVLDDPQNPCQFPQISPDSGTTRRRLTLANSITRRDHPLTGRVMVNRLWQHHFHTGIVATPDDFGARGSRPTHPDLLDWLTVEFIERGWRIKPIHRLILCATTYRQASLDDVDKRGADPSNRLLWHFPKRRLEAEALRDAILKVSGGLDQRLFGKSVPTEKLEDGQYGVPPDHSGRYRRSVYISTRRTWIPTLLATFDAPFMDTNCPRRSAGVIPQQALAVMNNPFILEGAERFAQRIMAEGGTTFDQRLRSAWLLAYGRKPSEEEVSLFSHFLEDGRRDTEDIDGAKSWRTICHALFSSNEFLYVD